MAYIWKDLAEEVLKRSDVPLLPMEIWEQANQFDLVSKLTYYNKEKPPKTPWFSIAAQLYVDVRDNEKSKFIKVGENPARFFLSSKYANLAKPIIEIPQKEEAPVQKVKSFHERKIHPLLAYFVYSNYQFNRGRGVFAKTIFHEKSKKNGFSEWLHPDMVGFYIPIKEWDNDLFEFNKIVDRNALTLFSFEIKKEINRSNYRECFFQAVSNSSWANEGYLVAASIDQDENLLNELERLSQSFGIGIIKIDLEDIENSSIIFPAKTKELLDWETMNKLSGENSDFKKFLQDIKIAFDAKRVYRTDYDEILEDPQGYINNELL